MTYDLNYIIYQLVSNDKLHCFNCIEYYVQVYVHIFLYLFIYFLFLIVHPISVHCILCISVVVVFFAEFSE